MISVMLPIAAGAAALFPKAAKGVAGAIGDAANYIWEGPEGNNYDPGQAWNGDSPQWGGEYSRDNMVHGSVERMQRQDKAYNTYAREVLEDRGGMARENQELSDNEAYSRGYDQAGALQLHREAAMGLAPSAAEKQMQAGLNHSLAQQQAIAGSARGAGGIAMAGANAAAQAGNLQQQAFTQGAQLRAGEMAQARDAYGGLASNVRQQDQNRLQMGNQMSQYNAGLNDQYKMGMGQLANQTAQTQQGWMQQAQNPYDRQLQADMNTQNNQAGAYSQHNALGASLAQAQADNRRAQYQNQMGLVSTAVNTFGQAVPKPGGGK